VVVLTSSQATQSICQQMVKFVSPNFDVVA
jgi:hypothetical protein